jgi:hypothetical protein
MASLLAGKFSIRVDKECPMYDNRSAVLRAPRNFRGIPPAEFHFDPKGRAPFRIATVMPVLLVLLGLALQEGAPPERAAREHALLMRQECAAALESVDGVTSVGVGGSGADYRILISVRDAASQRSVRDLVGDTYGGVRIVWSVAEAPRRGTPAEPPPEPARPAVPAPAPERGGPWIVSPLDCDILRDYLKLKPVTHPAGNGKSWVPCRVTRRTTIGPGGVTSFSYTDHRPDCPIRLGRVPEPPNADHFTAWVFRQGMTPPTGGNFTLPSNDWAWGIQAAADMASRLPSVREGSGSLWIEGYGWVEPGQHFHYPDAVPYYGPSSWPYFYGHPYRPCWHHHWFPIRACHSWRFGR